MSFFGSNKRRKVSSKEYSPVDAGEEERLGNSEDVNATAQEIAMLTTALRKTHLYIKILAGLLAALLVLWAASNFGHIAKSEDNKDSEIIDSPLPPSESTFIVLVPEIERVINVLVVGTQEVTFKENPIYAARPGPESNKAWNKLLPVSYLPPISQALILTSPARPRLRLRPQLGILLPSPRRRNTLRHDIQRRPLPPNALSRPNATFHLDVPRRNTTERYRRGRPNKTHVYRVGSYGPLNALF